MSEVCVLCGQLLPEQPSSTCPLCYSIGTSKQFVKVNGLNICGPCSRKPNVKVEVKQHLAKANAEAGRLAEAVKRDREVQAETDASNAAEQKRRKSYQND